MNQIGVIKPDVMNILCAASNMHYQKRIPCESVSIPTTEKMSWWGRVCDRAKKAADCVTGFFKKAAEVLEPAVTVMTSIAVLYKAKSRIDSTRRKKKSAKNPAKKSRKKSMKRLLSLIGRYSWA